MLSIIFAATVTLNWIANSESDLAGYKIYQSTTAGSYSSTSTDVGKVTTKQLTIPDDGNRYFVVTAYDLSGNESGFSNEVSYLDKKKPAAPGSLTITVAP